MRTTIRISDTLYRETKARAAREGRPVASVIEDAVRAYVAAPSAPSGTLAPLPTAGGSGVRPGIDLADRAALLDAMDEDTPLDARR